MAHVAARGSGLDVGGAAGVGILSGWRGLDDSGRNVERGIVVVSWTHVGRVWSNGEPFLALDAGSRGAWSEDDFEAKIIESGQVPDIPVGPVRAVMIGDGTVRDDSWIEVFQRADGAVAFVQTGGEGDYPGLLARALDSPAVDEDGSDIAVGSGQLAVFSSAADGEGEAAMPLVVARAGAVPSEHGWPSEGIDSGLLIGTGGVTSYRLQVTWHTELAGEPWGVFARWLLTAR